MTQTLVHRGPDADGVWLDPDGGVALGHRRLSVLDLSEHGNQPMLSPAASSALSIMGDLQSCVAAERAGRPGASLSWPLRHGSPVGGDPPMGPEAALPRLVGMFAFAVWDRQ